MAATTIREHIEITEGPSGLTPRIKGHRIRVQDVAIAHEKLGLSADEIVDWFPALSLGDVYAALAYYWDNRETIERAIDAERDFVDELRRVTPSKLRQKLARLSNS